MYPEENEAIVWRAAKAGLQATFVVQEFDSVIFRLAGK
jgi:hypothetical protein